MSIERRASDQRREEGTERLGKRCAIYKGLTGNKFGDEPRELFRLVRYGVLIADLPNKICGHEAITSFDVTGRNTYHSGISSH